MVFGTWQIEGLVLLELEGYLVGSVSGLMWPLNILRRLF